MRGDGDPASDMADNKIAVLICLSQAFRMADGCLFQVQCVEVDHPVYSFDSGHTGQVLELVHIRRIYRIRLCTVHIRKFLRNAGA